MTEKTLVNEPFHFQIHTKPNRSERIEGLYQYTSDSKAGVCIERAELITEIYQKYSAEPPIMLRALSLNHILSNMSLYVMPGSLLVGNQASKPNYSPLFPEFTIDFLEKELIHGEPYFPDQRPADNFEFDRSKTDDLKNIFDYWRGKTHKDRVYANLPEEAKLAQDEVNVVNIVNFLHGGCGHLTPPWPWLFENGIQEIIRICDSSLENLEMWTIKGIEKRRFYKATKVACEGILNYASRYADLTEELAKKEKNPKRKEELEQLAQICRKVPRGPAKTFHEALQFMTFVQFGIQIEDNAQGISPGRFDQVMFPFYEKDIKEKRLTRESALELIENFFVILSTIERIRSWDDTAYFRGKPIFQNLTTGGIDPKTGKDATNEISYLIMDAIANTRTLQPSHYVRWHKETPHEFKMKIAQTIRLGTGFPAIANDELYIPSMMNRGYEYEDAADYCIVGCAEAGVAGKRGGRTGAAWYCIAKVLELALYNGRDPRSGITLKENSSGKDLSTFSSFDEVWDAFLDQLRYYVKIHAIMDNITDRLWEEFIEEPFTSVMGCT